MGLSTAKKTRTTDQRSTENVTQTPTVAPWLDQSNQDYLGRVDALGRSDPSRFVAGPAPINASLFANAPSLLDGDRSNPMLDTGTSFLTNGGNAPANLSQSVAPGPASSWLAPTMAPAAQAEARGYTASQARAANLGPAAQAQAASILTSDLDLYRDRYLGQIRDTALSEADAAAGRVRAQQAAQAAGNRALGGSRHGIQEAATEGELARARAATDAGLLDRSFQTALGAAQYNAGNRQQTNVFNTGQTNQQDQYRAGLDTQTSLANLQAREAASQFGANAFNVNSMYNTGQTNEQAALQAQLQAQAASQNAGAENQFALAGAEMAQRNNQFNAGQAEAAAGRALQAGSALGQLGLAQADQLRQDLGLLSQIGGAQQQLAQAGALGPLALLEAEARARQAIDPRYYTTTNTVGNNTLTGREVERTRPSLFESFLALGDRAASAISGGLGG